MNIQTFLQTIKRKRDKWSWEFWILTHCGIRALKRQRAWNKKRVQPSQMSEEDYQRWLYEEDEKWKDYYADLM